MISRIASLRKSVPSFCSRRLNVRGCICNSPASSSTEVFPKSTLAVRDRPTRRLGVATAQYRATRASAVRLFPESAPKGNLYSVTCRSSGSIPAPGSFARGQRRGRGANRVIRPERQPDVGTSLTSERLKISPNVRKSQALRLIALILSLS
jgi:hypothetical protein